MTTPCRKSIPVNYQHPPSQAACCMTDILSIRQQQQAANNMVGIKSRSTTANQDQTEVCQCDICRSRDENP